MAGCQLPGLAAFMRRAKARVSGHPPSAGPGLWQLVDALAGAMVDTGEDRGPALAGEREPARGGEGGIRHASGPDSY